MTNERNFLYHSSIPRMHATSYAPFPLELDTNPPRSRTREKHDGGSGERAPDNTDACYYPLQDPHRGPGRKSSRLARRHTIRYSFPGWGDIS